MRVTAVRIALGLAAALSITPIASAQAPTKLPAMNLSPDERVRVVMRQAKAIGFDLSNAPQQGRFRNAVGAGGDTESFVRRTDSLTYLATDDRYYAGGKIDVFSGSDEALIAGSRRVLSILGVPANEIVRVSIEREYGTVGQYDRTAGTVKAERPQLLNRIASFQRSIGGIPVFSSYARIGLTRSGGVGMLRVHWPPVDDGTLKTAQALQARAREGFRPPAVAGAKPETFAAGIVHSPAVGEVMEVAAVIRVVYRPTDRRHSKKPVLLFDASGNPVPEPRVFLKPPPEQLQQRPTGTKSMSTPNPKPT